MARRRSRSETGRCANVVTMVHGTFARDAPWTRPDSALSRALLDAGCQVTRFEWSGRNSHRARSHAARQLAEHLDRQIAGNPHARQWVIAHSHGGNVALHAARHVRGSRRSTARVKTVALGTPFIHARPRGISGWPVFIVALFGVGLLVIAGATAVTGPRSFADRALVAGGALFAALVGLCVVGAHMHRKSIGRGWRSNLVASIHAPAVGPDDLLVVRAAGDEASSLLIAGQFVGWVSAVSSRLLTNLWFWACLIAAPEAALLASAVLDTDGRLAFNLLLYGFTLPGFVVLAVVTAMVGSAVVFGVDGPFVSLIAFSSAEAAPPGRATLMQLEPVARPTRKGLAHSSLYNEDLVIRRIVQSIRTSPAT
jgi:hypothetical protein